MIEDDLDDNSGVEDYFVDDIQTMIEGEIIKILNAASAAKENRAIRPLREIIQNADDAYAERLAIVVDENSISFFNDGECLTVYKGENKRKGSIVRIHQINSDFASEDNKSLNSRTSGNFGTGLRSAHQFSDKIEIHSRLFAPEEKKFMNYKATAFCNTRKLNEEMKDVMVYKVRAISERSKKKSQLPSDFTAFGSILFKLVFRRAEDLSDLRMQLWGSRTWDRDKVSKLVNDYLKSIPEILLGCRRLREVVFSVQLENHDNFGTHSFYRNFDLDDSFLEAKELGEVTSKKL